MEFLKDVLGEELYGKVAEKLKGNDKIKLANLATGDYVGKDKFTSAETEKTQLAGQLTERDKQLEELRKTAGDNKALQDQIAALQTANDKAKADFDGQMKGARLGFAIDARLLKEGVVNAKAVKALLDTTKINLDGDNLMGIDDQLKALKESEKWAFTQPAVPGTPGNPPPASGSGGNKLPTGVQIL